MRPILKVMSSRLTAALLLLGVASTAYAQIGRLPGVPADTHDVRMRYSDLVDGPLQRLARLQSTIETSRVSGTRVQVSREANERYRYLVFVPEHAGAFALDQAGTYVLRRRASDGALDQLKIFLRNDERFFVRIHPAGDGGTGTSVMSLFVAGVEIHHRIPLPVSIRDALFLSTLELLDLTDRRIDWSYLYPEIDPAKNQTVALVSSRARALLHTLPDTADGAMDEHGGLVSIGSGAAEGDVGFTWGFAKWIADGLSAGYGAGFLPLEPLTERHPELRGTGRSRAFEEALDPYFGLDWTRNLANALAERASVTGADYHPDHPEAHDVRSVPYVRYVEDAGFTLDELRLVLFLEASTRPGHLYFASVSQEFGSVPSVRQHVHVAVLLPYFDENGDFYIDVMERNVESSIDALERRYPDGLVHLVRAAVHEEFTPPVIVN